MMSRVLAEQKECQRLKEVWDRNDDFVQKLIITTITYIKTQVICCTIATKMYEKLPNSFGGKSTSILLQNMKRYYRSTRDFSFDHKFC